MTRDYLGLALTRFAPLSTLSRGAGVGLGPVCSKLLSRTAGEEGPSLQSLVGEGNLA